jgi:hypothetical protein
MPRAPVGVLGIPDDGEDLDQTLCDRGIFICGMYNVYIHSMCEIKVFWALQREIQRGERESMEKGGGGRGMHLGSIPSVKT